MQQGPHLPRIESRMPAACLAGCATIVPRNRLQKLHARVVAAYISAYIPTSERRAFRFGFMRATDGAACAVQNTPLTLSASGTKLADRSGFTATKSTIYTV